MTKEPPRVLLFSPPLRERTYPGRPPIYYLTAALRRAGYSAIGLDVDICGEAAFRKVLASFRPDVIAGTALSVQASEALRLFEIARQFAPRSLTVFGGNHATAAARHLYPLHEHLLDCIITGEGLRSIVMIADLIAAGEWATRRGGVPGSVFCENGVILLGAPACSELPDSYDPELPYESAYDFEIFSTDAGTARRTFQLMTAFGCENACFFCFSSVNKRGEAQRTERRMSIEHVEAILARAAGGHYQAVYFDDDTFTRDRDHAIAVSRLARKYGLVFGCHTRPDCEDDDLITELVANGCRYMFSGLESAVPEILLGANKTTDPARYKDAYTASYATKRRLGLPVAAFLVHGMPRRRRNEHPEITRTANSPRYTFEFDTLDDSFASIDFAVRDLDPTYLSMNILRFIPGVPFSESATFSFLRPTRGALHGGYFDDAWLKSHGAQDPRCYHPILRAFEGSGSPVPMHMTPARCYQILRYAVKSINDKNRQPRRNQTRLVVDPWFKHRFVREHWIGGKLTYELARFNTIEAAARVATPPSSLEPEESRSQALRR